MSDPRFASAKTDPRFRRPKQKNLKVEIDERFRDVLESEEFGGSGKGKGKGKAGAARVDKRGRPVTSSHHADQLKRFYRLRSPEAGEDEESSKAGFIDYARGEGALSSSGSEDEGSEEDSDVEEEELELGGKRRVKLPVGGDLESESDSEDESGSEGSHLEVDLSEDEASAFPPGASDAGEDEDEDEGEAVPPTARIAAVNLDWDNLRAADLYAVFNSFLTRPTGKGEPGSGALGKLVDVKIYPSEFGKERMEKEDTQGPGGGIFLGGGKKKDKKKQRIVIAKEESESEEDDEEDEEEDELEDGSEGSEGSNDFSDESEPDFSEDEDDYAGPAPKSNDRHRGEIDGLEIISDVESEAGSEDIDMDQLRQYQLERLRYYYAIATFSTVAAAEFVMNECNGTEFEQTANVMDLSYVPEGMDFDEDTVTDTATKEPKGYKGNDFVTDALRHSKVKLTWDQDDPNRVKLTRRTLTREEIEEQDFKNLVASSGSEASEPESEDEAEGDAPAAPSAFSAKAKKGPKAEKGGEKKTKKQAMKERTEKLRSLLLAGDEEGEGDIWGKAGTSWADELESIKASAAKDKAAEAGAKGKGKGKKGEDLEITFRPGLSVAQAGERDEENMTSLERYQMRMKEKKQRKKEKMEMKAAAREAAADDEEGAKGKKSGKDDFFGSDSEGEAPPAKSGKGSGKAAKSSADAATTTKAKPASLQPSVASAPDLSLVASSSAPDTNFSMKDILRAEKDDANKKRKRRRGAKKNDAEREEQLGPDGWKIDVKDERFKALHEEPDFAIDPSNPHFTKTKAMKDLLAERSRVRNAKQPQNEPEARKSASGVVNVEHKEQELDSLVQSVKRKMDQNQHKAKRKRSRK
ncbi:hypothetical protein IAT38_004360 [Cryptococcus sp. DSM 104549]